MTWIWNGGPPAWHSVLVNPEMLPQNTPFGTVGRIDATGRRAKPVVEGKAKRDCADGKPHMRIGHVSSERPSRAHANRRARQHHFQIPAVPVAAIDDHRNDVLQDQDGQQDRGCLQRWHDEREQWGCQQPDAGKAALGHPQKRDRRNGGEIKNGVGDNGHGIGSAPAIDRIVAGKPAGRAVLRAGASMPAGHGIPRRHALTKVNRPRAPHQADRRIGGEPLSSRLFRSVGAEESDVHGNGQVRGHGVRASWLIKVNERDPPAGL